MLIFEIKEVLESNENLVIKIEPALSIISWISYYLQYSGKLPGTENSYFLN
jgi:hypothetical protein